MKLKHITAPLVAAMVMMAAAVRMPFSSCAADLETYAEQVVILTNMERESAGLSPVYMVPKLSSLATVRSTELVLSFSHTRPDGTSVSSMLSNNDIDWWVCGENVAYGQTTPVAAVDGWMNSTGHRANVLAADFNQIGVGVSRQNNIYYWTQIFVGGSLPADAYLPKVLLGDLNSDKQIDSSDAAAILTASARLGANKTSGLDILQEIAADVDGNNTINSSDAGFILMYSAISGVGTTSLEEVVRMN